jgi:hypothetical protein
MTNEEKIRVLRETLNLARSHLRAHAIVKPSLADTLTLRGIDHTLSTTEPAPRDSSAPGEENYRRVEVCHACSGSGGAPANPCGWCRGTGYRDGETPAQALSAPQPAAGEGGADHG